MAAQSPQYLPEDPIDPSLTRCFRGHEGACNAVAFHPNMQEVVSGGNDGTVRVWHFKPQLRAYRFVGHTVCSKPFTSVKCI